ncbi:MAG: RsmB/NOP family class I SAM-dependent RNA methyltransferase [Oligoflexia bacterium]|nr:RsmB/NOP family class I SAM-dependent RNA methyltransferase [Oligoflexia bacterium]MBF0364861.1 RsmB/NOP family class I SAM-dependent RNA methyltransferase [Oligoflexia bacterium]
MENGNKKSKENSKEKSKEKKGYAGFTTYYQNIFGVKRWEQLLLALESKERRALLANPYVDADALVDAAKAAEARGEDFPPPSRLQVGKSVLLNYYIMDYASILAAQALRVAVGDRVLDLCAAPGGKSLVLAYALLRAQTQAQAGELLTLNEFSKERRERLKRTLRDYLPTQELEQRVQFSARDASNWCLYEEDVYDKILLDAPCSSERHLLKRPEEMQKWSKRRSERLSQQQYAMLISALRALKDGGRLVYSTCALSPLENDGVISRVLARFKQQRERKREWAEKSEIVVVKDLEFSLGEEREYGRMILPDSSEGWGPMYIAVLKKTEMGM